MNYKNVISLDIVSCYNGGGDVMTLIICSILIIIGLLIGINKSPKYKKVFLFALKAFVIILALEVTVFNVRFYQSLFYQKINVSRFVIGSDIKQFADGSLQVIGEENNYIEITGINEHLDNIYMDFDLKESRILFMRLGYTDEANKQYSITQERRISATNAKDGSAMRLHLAGKTEKIRIYLTQKNELDTFKIREISFNTPVKLNLSIVRVLIIFSFVMLLFAFRPKSSIYKLSLFDKKANKYIAFMVVIQLVLFAGISQFNYYFVAEDFDSPSRLQYQYLAESILHGKPYLEVEPGEALKKLENPYDRENRDKILEEVGEEYIWDVAYFKGKYYVYFGVAPVLTYYLPFYALTGHHIKTYQCIYITMIAVVIGLVLLLRLACKKWFKKMNVGVFLALTILFINSCGLLAIMGRPDHYSLPILMGIMFSIYGLYWWLKADSNDLKSSYLFIGSLCMAAVAMCRPQILMTSFFAIPIFWNRIKNRELFSKKTIKKTLCFVIPYIMIAIPLMYYNYVRFGSIFDFGANYNLTTNDMTRRGWNFDRIPLGIYYYLFNPVKVSVKFPFILRERVVTSYLGTTICEPIGAGFIMVNLLVLFAFFIRKFKDKFDHKLPYKLGCASVIFALIIMIADTQMAGILDRYFCDFAFLLYFATCLVIFAIFNKKQDNPELRNIIYFCLIVGLIYNFLLMFSDNVLENNWLFFYLRSLVEFWI